MASPRGQLEVTMHVYSGRPNPTWTIDEDLADPDLQFEGLKRQAKLQPERLGYRGFTVKRKETGIPPPVPTVLERAAPTPAMAVGAAAGAGAGLSRPSEDLSIVDVPQLEQKLLDTSKDISSTLKHYVSSCLSAPSIARSPPVTLESAALRGPVIYPGELIVKEVEYAPPFEPSKWNDPIARSPPVSLESAALHEPGISPGEVMFEGVEDAPPFEPSKWNDPDHQPYNNCYNYANNIMTDTNAQPGRAAGQIYTGKTGPEIKKASQADGLSVEWKNGWTFVALAIWPHQDYHWYRLDNTGYWSHKPGDTPVTDTDNSGNKINDPEKCDMGHYTFVCYMWTHSEIVDIE